MSGIGFGVGRESYGSDRVLIIAEIGTGHGGDPVKALELVSAAIESGADCVKFQHVYADEILHPATGLVPLPGGMTSLYETFRALETGPAFLAGLKERAEALGALFLCTPFGPRSARELRELGVKAIKVASPELNYSRLLDEIASYRLPTILSSGVSRLSDIEYALDKFSAAEDPAAGSSPVALLHCVTSYPAPEAEYNLRVLAALSTLFGVPVGVSDHSADPSIVPALAVAAGAALVEKHFCLSRKDGGLDDPIALPPDEFSRMVGAVREVSTLRSEAGEGGAVAALAAEYGDKRVEAILGDGVKRLAPSERDNYTRTNRSVHARRPIARGERFDDGNLAVLRTEKVLRPGLEPRYLPLVLGRLAARDVPDGEGLEWPDVGGA